MSNYKCGHKQRRKTASTRNLGHRTLLALGGLLALDSSPSAPFKPNETGSDLTIGCCLGAAWVGLVLSRELKETEGSGPRARRKRGERKRRREEREMEREKRAKSRAARSR